MKYTEQRDPNTVNTKLYLSNPIGDLIALYTGHTHSANKRSFDTLLRFRSNLPPKFLFTTSSKTWQWALQCHSYWPALTPQLLLVLPISTAPAQRSVDCCLPAWSQVLLLSSRLVATNDVHHSKASTQQKRDDSSLLLQSIGTTFQPGNISATTTWSLSCRQPGIPMSKPFKTANYCCWKRSRHKCVAPASYWGVAPGCT